MNHHIDRTETILAQLRVKLMIHAHIEDNPQGFTTHHKEPHTSPGPRHAATT